jgi:hypothetical protein
VYDGAAGWRVRHRLAFVSSSAFEVGGF